MRERCGCGTELSYSPPSGPGTTLPGRGPGEPPCPPEPCTRALFALLPQDRAPHGLTCGLQCWLQALHTTEVLGRFCFSGRSSLYCWEVPTLVYPNPPTVGKMSGRQPAEPAVVSIMGILTPWDPHPMAQQTWGPCPCRPGSQGLCHSTLGSAWLGRAGSSVCHTMHCACPCLLLQDPAPSRRIFPTFSEAQESPAQPLQPLGWEPFALTTRLWPRVLAQLSQSGDANASFSGAYPLGSLGILQHYPSARAGTWLCTGRSRYPRVRQG